MQQSLYDIEYKLPNGEVLKRTIDLEDGIIIEDIDALTMQYFEKSGGHMPDKVFVRYDLYIRFVKMLSFQTRHNASQNNVNPSNLGVTLYLSLGTIRMIPVLDSYIPLLVGSDKDFEDNNLNKVFEEVVLKDCEYE